MKCQKCGNEYEGQFCPNCGEAANSTQAKKKPIFRRWWFWVLIVLVVLIVAIGTGGRKESSKGNDKDVAVGNVNDSTVEDTSKPEEASFTVGDTVALRDLTITANSMEESNGKDYFVPKDGNVFVGVNLTIENTSDKDQALSTLLLFSAYIDGVKCEYSVTANCAFSDGTLDGTLSPGKKMVGYYAVEVPENWSELELQVSPTFLSSTKSSAVFVFKK